MGVDEVKSLFVSVILVSLVVSLGLPLVHPASAGAPESVSISQSPDSRTVTPGTNVTFRVDLTVPEEYNGAGIDVDLPSGWDVVSQESNGSFRESENQWIWLYGGNKTLSYTVRVPSTASGGSYSIVANGSAVNPDTDEIESDETTSTIVVESSSSNPGGNDESGGNDGSGSDGSDSRTSTSTATPRPTTATATSTTSTTTEITGVVSTTVLGSNTATGTTASPSGAGGSTPPSGTTSPVSPSDTKSPTAVTGPSPSSSAPTPTPDTASPNTGSSPTSTPAADTSMPGFGIVAVLIALLAVPLIRYREL